MLYAYVFVKEAKTNFAISRVIDIDDVRVYLSHSFRPCVYKAWYQYIFVAGYQNKFQIHSDVHVKVLNVSAPNDEHPTVRRDVSQAYDADAGLMLVLVRRPSY